MIMVYRLLVLVWICDHATMSEVDIRQRQATDLPGCVEALALVHRSDEYPTNWPADPTAFLVPVSPLPAWIAVTHDAEADGAVGGEVVVGHLVLRPTGSRTPGWLRSTACS